MSGVRKVCRLTLLLCIVGGALTFEGLSAHAQDSQKVEPPDGLTAVSPPVPMPAFALPGLNGEAFNSSTLQNQVVVLRFWATW
jgi:cytochrome oxidase Cu insertion factor (SCO1/SenC/PrrC family)